MVGMAGLQVFVVRFFFQGARKGMCAAFGERVCADGVGCRVCVDGVCWRCLEGSVGVGNGSAYDVAYRWLDSKAIRQFPGFYTSMLRVEARGSMILRHADRESPEGPFSA